MLSAAQLAQRSASAGNPAASRPTATSVASVSRLATTPSSPRKSMAKATAVRGTRVPITAQTGLSRRAVAQPNTAPCTPARANQAQAASSVHPTRMERRSAKRASSGNSFGRSAGGGTMRKRESGGDCGSISSGSRGGSDTARTYHTAGHWRRCRTTSLFYKRSDCSSRPRVLGRPRTAGVQSARWMGTPRASPRRPRARIAERRSTP